MSWLKKIFGYITRDNVLRVAAGTVAIAGIPAALAAAGVAVPVGLAAVATKVVVFGTTVGVVAAKVLPGNGKNAPSAGPGQKADAEDPK